MGKPLNPSIKDIRECEEAIRAVIIPALGDNVPSKRNKMTTGFLMDISVMYPDKRARSFPYQTSPHLDMSIYPYDDGEGYCLRGVSDRGSKASIQSITFRIVKSKDNRSISWSCHIYMEGKEREKGCRKVCIPFNVNCCEIGARPSDWDFSKFTAYLRHIKEHPCKINF